MFLGRTPSSTASSTGALTGAQTKEEGCRTGSIRATSLQPETDPHLYLEFGLPVSDSTPNLVDLEPIEIPERLICLHQSVTNRLMDAFVGYANYSNNFVCVFRHRYPLPPPFAARCTAPP